MKTQIDLTKLSLDKQKQNDLDELGYKKGYVGGKNWSEIKYIYNAYEGEFILLIKEYNTPKEKLIEIIKETLNKISAWLQPYMFDYENIDKDILLSVLQ